MPRYRGNRNVAIHNRTISYNTFFFLVRCGINGRYNIQGKTHTWHLRYSGLVLTMGNYGHSIFTKFTLYMLLFAHLSSSKSKWQFHYIWGYFFEEASSIFPGGSTSRKIDCKKVIKINK